MQARHDLTILGTAQADLEEIAQLHLELVGPNSARNISDKIYGSLDRLRDFPFMGTAIGDEGLRKRGFRKLVSGNYLCFYRVVQKTVLVYHIVDGRTEYKRLFRDLASGNVEDM